MSMSNGMGGMKESPEQLPGMQVEQLDLQKIREFASQIRGLRYNALDTGKNRAPHQERKGELKDVKDSFLRSAEHKVAFVALHEGSVVGFLSVDKVPQGKKAKINDLWTDRPGRPQRGIVGKLLNSARDYLSDHGYPKLGVEPIHASSDFSVVTANPELGRFMRITRPGSEEVEDIALAPEELPEISDAPSLSAESFSEDTGEADASLEKAA